jgi:hypothetical protein
MFFNHMLDRDSVGSTRCARASQAGNPNRSKRYGQIGRARSYPGKYATRLQTVQARQVEIQDDRIVVAIKGQVECPFTIDCGVNTVTPRFINSLKASRLSWWSSTSNARRARSVPLLLNESSFQIEVEEQLSPKFKRVPLRRANAEVFSNIFKRREL